MNFNFITWFKNDIDFDKEAKIARNKDKKNTLMIVKSNGPSRRRVKTSIGSNILNTTKFSEKKLAYKRKRRIKNRITRKGRRANR